MYVRVKHKHKHKNRMMNTNIVVPSSSRVKRRRRQTQKHGRHRISNNSACIGIGRGDLLCKQQGIRFSMMYYYDYLFFVMLMTYYYHRQCHAFQQQQCFTVITTSYNNSNCQVYFTKNSFTSLRRRDIIRSTTTCIHHSKSLSSSAAACEQDITAILGTPVELKFTEYSNSSNDEHEHEHEHENDPVILLHGLLGQKRNFASLGTSLSSQLQKKRKIYALDLRNHGDNHHDWRTDMSYTHMCHDVLQFMNNRKISKAILIGHSMGGKVAKSLALSYPNRISGLVVLDIAPVRYTEKDAAWKAVKNIIDSLQMITIEKGMTKRTIDTNLRSLVEDPALRAFVLTNLEEDRKNHLMKWKINLDSIAKQLDVIAGFDVNCNELGEDDDIEFTQYTGDTLFINGGTSSFVKGGHMPRISQYFPNYMLTTIKGSGHWVHAEAPDDTLAILKRYLDR